ncbi:MAG: amino acid adenylation enzyme/thioester reductase family protein [Acidobacteria bacterium]|nr:amino acid adenylation enzyme/thioester reductase family protein [Acidobacteriota bacterium]
MHEHLPITTTNSSLPDISDAKRALLQKYLRGDLAHSTPESRVIARRAPGSSVPPSFGQEQLWLHAQLSGDFPLYNEPVTVRRTGPLDLVALKQSLNEIIRRHEAWRTTFSTRDGQLVQIINPPVDLELPVVDLCDLEEGEREAEALRLATEDARRPFDLNNGPLLRAMLVRLNDADHRLFITLHQIIFDGVSLYSVFLPELASLYESFVNGQPSGLAELPIQYGDFAAWQRDQLRDEALSDELAYWKKQLTGAPTALELPTDRPRPAIQTFHGEQLSFTFPQQLSEALKLLSRREGTTLFMTLLAAFQTLLYRYTEQDDLLVGTVTTNRKRSEFDELLGFFLNTLVLRTDLAGDPTFHELLGRVRKVTVDALAHGDVPVHRLLKELERERDLSRNPLFQVMFVLEPPLPAPRPGWELSQVDVDAGIARVDLYLELDDRPEGLVGRFRYNSDLFDAASINGMLAHLRTLLEGVVANPECRISDYPLRAEFGDTGDLAGGNSVRLVNPFTSFAQQEIEQSIPARFESQVRKYSRNIAVKSRTHQWSYEELNRQANRIAQTIFNQRGEGEERIAILFDHDAPMIAALLGTLKAGKTYVPLDPSYPIERLAYILADSQAVALLTNDANLALAQELTADGVELINIDQMIDYLDTAATFAGAVDVPAERLAYILYTSGSTGNPKGVMQTHRNVLHFIRAYTNNLHISANDRLTLLSSYCFDAALMDIYGALLNGATLYPVDIKEEGLAGLTERLSDEGITIYHSTPTVYRYFINSLTAGNSFTELRLVVLGGEEVTRTDVDLYKKHFADDCLLVNGLGPTEATVSLQYFIDKGSNISGQGVPVGYPVTGTEIVLLNRAGKPAEIRGEISIRCEHVALGYWRNAKATEAAFSQESGVRVYRTGDMGRRLPDGSIVFEGRKDFQIKIRGFRVELGEIEAALSQHPAVRENVVVLSRTNAGDKQLAAYVVIKPDPAAGDIDLRSFLKNKLPDYMLPTAFVVLDSLPMTASGKLNRRALPEPKEFADQTKVTFTPPQTIVEKLLAGIWSDLLGVKEPGINDNFFESGGHSLLAVRLFALVEKELGKRLPLATLFRAPTIAQLAEIIDRDWTSRWTSLVPIQTAGSKPPFFCVHALGGTVIEYYDLARHLGPDQPFYGLQAQGVDGQHSPHTTIEDMAAHYIKEIREVQPSGPYFIGGRSMGGTIAFEMACQLERMGEQVGSLALLDTYPSGYVKLLLDAERLSNKFALFARRIGCHFSNLKGLAGREKFRYGAEKMRYVPARIKASLWRRAYRLYQNFGRQLPRALSDVREFNTMARLNYAPQVFGGEVTLFWASQDLRGSFDLVTGWRVLAGGGMNVHEVSGNHLNLIKEPYVSELAVKLQNCLQKAQAQVSIRLNQTGIAAVSDEVQPQEEARPRRFCPPAHIKQHSIPAT